MSATHTLIERKAYHLMDGTGAISGCTTGGSNKFYVQELRKTASGSFDVWIEYGRMGKTASNRGSKFGMSHGEARRVFDANHRKRISTKKGYTEIQERTDEEEAAKAKPVKAAKVKRVATKARSFHPQVERLLGIIYDGNASTVRRGLASRAGATADNPIGNLSDHQLDSGGLILQEVQDELIRQLGQQTQANKDKAVDLTPAMSRMSSRYFSAIPREIPASSLGPANFHRIALVTHDRVADQQRFLQLLRDAQVSTAVFKQAAAVAPASKVGVWHDGLGCEIEWCEGAELKRVKGIFDTGQSKRNANWWRGNTSRVELVGAWKFTRTGSEARFDRFSREMAAKRDALGNIMAWHGTRTANLLGIGKGGLLMPENLPRGVHVSGKAFGRGIYHAPAWTATDTRKVHGKPTDGTNGALKSMNYTGVSGAYYGGSDSGNAFMFLQEVALGCGEVRTSACWDKRRPDRFPDHDFIYANAGGCSSLTHDEIVTFNEDAQIFRYLCEIRVR